jgi:dTDP-4-amino-4,6-dideoxygalactose transaminase
VTDVLAIHGGSPLRTRPFAAWPELGDEERSAVSRVLESRSWGGHPSPNTEARAFAREFASYTGANHVVPCTSGTTALLLALQAAGLSPGAEVVTTSYSFVATAGAISQAGHRPVPVDVLESSYCIDPDLVEAAITDRCEAILPVHLASSMADMDRLSEIAARRGLVLIEDCAHAHGARWRDRGAGSIGDFACFSMQSTKLLTAGEGGAVSARDPASADRLWSLVNCGRKESGYDGFAGRMLGHNFRITEWQAAVLRAQLRRLDEQHERRSLRIAQLEQAIEGIPGLSFLAADPRVTRRTHYQTILRYDKRAFEGVGRDDVLAALHAEGLACFGRFYVPIDEDPLFARDPATNPAVSLGLGWPAEGFPIARRAALHETIWLPHELFLGTHDDVRDIAAILARVQAAAGSLVTHAASDGASPNSIADLKDSPVS